MTTFKSVFEGAQEAFRAEPDQAQATFAAESRQVRGLESKAEIRGFSLTVDEPEELGGSDQGPSPSSWCWPRSPPARRSPTGSTPTRWAFRSTGSRSR